jgi:hypothetical protein
MNWDHHQEVLDASHEWASGTIQSLLEQGDPVLEAMLDLAR